MELMTKTVLTQQRTHATHLSATIPISHATKLYLLPSLPTNLPVLFAVRPPLPSQLPVVAAFFFPCLGLAVVSFRCRCWRITDSAISGRGQGAGEGALIQSFRPGDEFILNKPTSTCRQACTATETSEILSFISPLLICM